MTVNAVAPGPTATGLSLDGKDAGTPGDIAGVGSFMTGPERRWMNGQVVRANGGII